MLSTTAAQSGSPASLPELERRDDFLSRHIGTSPEEQAAMLGVMGAPSVAVLLEAAVPAAIRSGLGLPVEEPITEQETIVRLRRLAARNQLFTSLIGLGYHGTITPPVIARNVLESPAWYTAYTPYQAEISQGRLEALLNFQTLVADLTGMGVANASLLDEGTAAAEAMAMARRAASGPADAFLVDPDTHPQTVAVLRTRAEPIGVRILVADPDSSDLSGCFGALLSYPGSSGEIRDWRATAAAVRAAGGTVVVTADPLALVLLEPPGAWGADIVVGSSQRFGVPMGFGGPHAAFIATGEHLVRSLPGRLVGVSADRHGRPALRLALQTREQHIRRERATSNICTAQVLLAVVAGLYAVWHGPDGLRRIAGRVHRLTSLLAAGLRAEGVEVVNHSWFDTITVRVHGTGASERVHAGARRAGLNLRPIDSATVGITLDETTTTETIEQILTVFGVSTDLNLDDDGALVALPADLRRSGALLTHPVFNRYHSEHEMLRYLRRLSDRDLALDRTMIPLGSCTMKLNATTEMLAVTWPEFADIHPFAPLDQIGGYLELIGDLERMLARCTGYDAVSLQPNAGSQGELAGLLAIRAYHRSRHEGHRTVCLIPSSAHGTNAASAAMAGMEIVVVECDANGNVSLTDLRAKAERHAGRLAAVMVTYPSTHGVYEQTITEICRLVHDHGGQVYVDGANLNALVGIARPGAFGADVSHLNLHKTFCIPHGGGGPGVGPVAVRAHLAPFLPTHPLRPEAGPDGSPVGPVSSAPWGSAGILVVSWAYLRLMGDHGLRRATESAVLHANYLARRLDPYFPVLYRGPGGHVAHECIIDLRGFTGVGVDDVAKRLIDYGFHAPTMSFPVVGTLMVEPTESESRHELDRFCAAMAAIRGEIERVATGEWPLDDNPLVNAPHTAEEVAGDRWDHPYSRSLAAYPLDTLKDDKYFPPVGRVDGPRGDRNLMCACPPIEESRRGS